MATYYAIYNRQTENGLAKPQEPKYNSATILEAPEAAVITKLEAANIAEAQRTIQHYYQGRVTGTVVCVTEAQFKES